MQSLHSRGMTRILLLAGIAAGLSACAADSGGYAGGPQPVNTGLSSLASTVDTSPQFPAAATVEPTAIEKLGDEHPVDVQALLDRGTSKDVQPIAPPAAEEVRDPEPVVKAAAAEPQPEVVTAPQTTKTLAERIDDASLLLIDLLRQESAGSEDPFHSAMALAALEAVRPGSASKVITPDSTDGGPLPDEQRTLVNAFKDLVSGLMVVSRDKKPEALNDRAAELADAFIRSRPMRIHAAMVAKVTGFGQYIPLGNGKFQQGKPIRAVIYTEVRRFQQRPLKDGDTGKTGAQPGDAYAVELSQELQLIHDADGVKAWQRNEQPITETSRNTRHDFYLVENLTLLPTLSIGAYKLKVIVRDKSSGQEDEAIISFEVVADPALVSDTGTRMYD